MPRNPDSPRRFALALASIAALAGGALGWWLGPVRPASPETAAHSGPAKPAPISQSKSTTGLPYDLGRVASGALEDFVDLDAWLVGATCEEVWALLDRSRRPQGLVHSPLLDKVLRQRFRAFSPEDRLAVVRAHTTPGKTFLPVDADIVTDLMADLVPARLAEAAAVSKFINDTNGYRTAMALERWAKQDFEATLAFAKSLGHPEARYLAILIRHLATADLPAASVVRDY